MSAGIYKLNGNYAYTLNIEKKQKRKKDLEIIEIYSGPLKEHKLEEYLVNKVRELSGITEKVEDQKDSELTYYYFKNSKNNHTITNTKNNLNDLKSCININDWSYIGNKKIR